MTIVRDYMLNENNGNVRIELHLKEDRDPCTAFYELMWSGLLQDIPEEYQELEVIDEGWAIGAQCNILEVVQD